MAAWRSFPWHVLSQGQSQRYVTIRHVVPNKCPIVYRLLPRLLICVSYGSVEGVISSYSNLYVVGCVFTCFHQLQICNLYLQAVDLHLLCPLLHMRCIWNLASSNDVWFYVYALVRVCDPLHVVFFSNDITVKYVRSYVKYGFACSSHSIFVLIGLGCSSWQIHPHQCYRPFSYYCSNVSFSWRIINIWTQFNYINISLFILAIRLH